MNRHLIESRLKSYQHYNKEIERLEEAIKATKETQKELLEEFNQIKILEPGDVIIINGKKPLVFIEQEKAGVSSWGEEAGRPSINLVFRRSDSYGELELKSTRDDLKIKIKYFIDSPLIFKVIENIAPKKEIQSETSTH